MPAIRDWTYNYNTSTSSTTIAATMPQYTAGDLLVAVLSTDTTAQTWSLAGWTQLFSVTNTPNLGVMWKIAGASETNPTFTYTGAETANVTLISIQDTHPTTPFDDYDTANRASARQAMPVSVLEVTDSLILYASTHGSTAVVPSIIEGPVTQLVAKDGSAHADSTAWAFQRALGNTPSDIYSTVTGTTYNGVLATIVINPPATGAAIIPAYCSADNSTYIDPVHGVSAFRGNTALANTVTTYFGTRVKDTALAAATVAASTDYGINTYRSCGNATGPTTANTWFGSALVLADANRPNITDKNVLAHFMPLLPADMQTVYDVALGKGCAFGFWSPDSVINACLAYNANTTTYVDETVDINSGTANDVLLPPQQITTIGDAFYIGATGTFNSFKITIGTAGVYTDGTLQWQYYNGSTWAALTMIVDPTAYLKSAVTNAIIKWTIPVDWTQYSVFSLTKYWVRCVVTVNPSARTTTPLATQASHPNTKVWHVHGFKSPWGITRAPCIIHPSNTTGVIDSMGTLDITLIKGVGFFTSGYLTSSDWVYTMIWSLGTLAIAGGTATLPILVDDIQELAAAGHERMSVVKQGAGQLLILQPIQFGDGGPNETHLQLDLTAIEFPSLYNTTTRQVYYCSSENFVGITYYAGIYDSIIHKNSTISSPSKYKWGVHASSSISASYTFTGLVLIGAGTITLKAGITFSGITFNTCDKIDAIGATITSCTFQDSSSTQALEVVSPSELALVTNCVFVSNTNAINITTAGTYTLSGCTFSGNTYDIENSSSGLVTVNCNGSNPITYINTSGGSTIINNIKVLVITCKDDQGLAVSYARVRIEKSSDSSLVCEGVATVLGVFTYDYNYTTSLAVNIICRLKGYQNFSGTGTIESTGMSVPVTMPVDESINLP